MSKFDDWWGSEHNPAAGQAAHSNENWKRKVLVNNGGQIERVDVRSITEGMGHVG